MSADSTPTSSTPPDPPPPAGEFGRSLEGRRIGRCEVRERVGKPSGMGEVYKAVHEVHGVVAFKDVLRGSGADEVEFHKRLHHDHVIRLYDEGRHAGPGGVERTYLVLEWADGGTVVDYADGRALAQRERIGLVVEAARGVAHVHSMGGLHLDLKPGNILVVKGRAKVGDFGVSPARLAARGRYSGGTPVYMSPEQLGSLEMELDGRADVYSLGVVLHELCYGRRPHEEPNVTGRPPIAPAGAENEDPALWRVIARALAPRREDRYERVDEFIAALAPLASMRRLDRARAAVRRRPGRYGTVAASPVIMVLAALVGVGAVRVAQKYTSLDRKHLDRIGAATGLAEGASSGVLVLTATEPEQMVELGQRLGLAGVSAELASWRAIYARVVDEAANAGAAAVVFDIQFRTDSPEIAGMASAIRRARDEHRMGVVVGEFDWPLDAGRRPATHAALLDAGAIPSGIMIGQTGDRTVAVPRAAQRPGGPVIPSLTTAAYGAARHPGTLSRLRMSEDGKRIVMEFTEVTPPFRTTGPTEEMTVVPQEYSRIEQPHGREPGDLTYFAHVIPFADEGLIKECTLTLPEFFALGSAERSTRLSRSLVFVFNPGGEGTLPGTNVPLAYSHVSLLRQMLGAGRQPATLVTSAWVAFGAIALGIVLGAAIASRLRGAVALGAVLGALAGGAMLAWWGAPAVYGLGAYFHPIFIAAAFAFAVVSAACVYTCAQRRRA